MGIVIITLGCFVIINGWIKKPAKRKPVVKCDVFYILN